MRDENQDFELNTRGVFGGRGLIDDDRLFLAIGGSSDPRAIDSGAIEQFQQCNWRRSARPTICGTARRCRRLPASGARRDFAIATLGDDRVFIIGGRSGGGQGTLISGTDAVLEFNPRTNIAARTQLDRLHAATFARRGGGEGRAGGRASTRSAATPARQPRDSPVEHRRGVQSRPRTPGGPWRRCRWRRRSSASRSAGGVNTAEPRATHPRRLAATPARRARLRWSATTFGVQRFQADPVGPGVWTQLQRRPG